MPGREQVFESKDSGGIYTRWPTHGQVWVGKEKKKTKKQLLLPIQWGFRATVQDWFSD